MDVGDMPWSPRVMPERSCLSFPRSQNNLGALGCMCLSCWKKFFPLSSSLVCEILYPCAIRSLVLGSHCTLGPSGFPQII